MVTTNRKPAPPPFDPAKANAVRVYRTARGMSQSELGARLGVSRQTVNAWEVGKHRPGPSHAPELATALGVDPVALIGWLSAFVPSPK